MDLVSPESGSQVLEEQFDRLFNEQYVPMVRLAAFLVDRQQIAEEIVQDAFRRVWETFATVQDPVPYLRRSVVNGAHGELRRRRVRRVHPDHTQPQPATESDYLLDVLGALPLRKRTALVLRFYGGLSMKEIAEVMEVSTGTVKSTIHRGLADLRKELS